MSVMRGRITTLAALVFACGLLGAGSVFPARAESATASWQFAPAEAPPPPAGAAPAPYPVQLGEVGEISFWAPNRGLLITAGNSVVPMGLYAYDGVSWHQLSNVCGGTDGKIAWAGPDEFWTIADQRPGQVLPRGGTGALEDVSLCHFKEGKVIASYATPLEQADSYQRMDAAACDGPNDCWFGGELDSQGAFHLHWNGSEMSIVNAPQDHAIAAMALYDDVIYESVRLSPSDTYTGEEPANPVLLHTIVPTDPAEYFHDVEPATNCAVFCTPLPEYGKSEGKQVAPVTLAGFALSSDWSIAGTGPASPQLWAIAGRDGIRQPKPQQEGEGNAHPIALRYANGTWTQVVPNLASFGAEEEPVGVAAEPPESDAKSGEGAAWVMLHNGSQEGEARVARLLTETNSEGKPAAKVAETDVLGTAQGVGPRGNARAIACPAAQECWLATNQGWLFHLTDGSPPPQNGDPFFDGQDGVLEYRPPDDGTPQTLPFAAPEDDSLANQQPPPPPVTTLTPTIGKPKAGKAKRLVTQVKTRLIERYTLQLSFTLAARAHVKLTAIRHGKTVARTPDKTFAKGKHALLLHLNPERWPTKLDLHATPLEKSGAPVSESGGEPDTVST